MSEAALSRVLPASKVPDGGIEVEIVADETERERIAAANEVESIGSFAARLEIRPFGRGGLIVRGRLEAEATRLCGVTLEPFVERVDEEIEVRFAPDAPADADGAADENAPDPLIDGAVDLGAVATEFFTLGLTPYPRKPGATLISMSIETRAIRLSRRCAA